VSRGLGNATKNSRVAGGIIMSLIIMPSYILENLHYLNNHTPLDKMFCSHVNSTAVDAYNPLSDRPLLHSAWTVFYMVL
jgi:hypothetical protein